MFGSALPGQDPAPHPLLPQFGSTDQPVPSKLSIQSYPLSALLPAGRTGTAIGSAVSVVGVWVTVCVLMR